MKNPFIIKHIEGTPIGDIDICPPTRAYTWDNDDDEMTEDNVVK